VPTDLPIRRSPAMKRILRGVIDAIVLSIGIVAAAVGTTYG
jgi:sulfonate transport system substrate-binding protein